MINNITLEWTKFTKFVFVKNDIIILLKHLRKKNNYHISKLTYSSNR